MRRRASLFALGVALAAQGAGCGRDSASTEPPIPGVRRVTSLSVAASLACPGGASFSFNEGTFYEALRAALLDARNFGPDGKVPVTFQLRPAIDLVRTGALGRTDILVVNRPRGPLDAPAMQALRQFVMAGGAVLSLGDERQTFLADPGQCSADPQAEVESPADGASPPSQVAEIMDGPFGAVGESYGTGYNCAFTNIDPGAVALSHNGMGPNGLVLDGGGSPGAGRVVAFADEEVFSDVAVVGCASAQFVPGNPNERLALNTFAYLAKAVP